MYIVIGIVALFVIFIIVMVNSLIGKKNQVENAFAGIDVQLKKRCDLVPNLVAAVQKYMTHERGVLEDVTALRAKAMEPGLPADERMRLDGQLSGMLRNLMVQVESYPQLKASENVMQLQRSLNEVEEQIAAIRRTYNAAVTDYNNAVEMFPSNLIAGMMSYRRRELFSIPEADRANVDVQALFNR